MRSDKDIESAGNIGPLSQQIGGSIDFTGIQPFNESYDFAVAQDVDKANIGQEPVGPTLQEVQVERDAFALSPKLDLQQLRANYPFVAILPIPFKSYAFTLDISKTMVITVPDGAKMMRLVSGASTGVSNGALFSFSGEPLVNISKQTTGGDITDAHTATVYKSNFEDPEYIYVGATRQVSVQAYGGTTLINISFYQ